MRIKEFIDNARKELHSSSSSPLLDAELLCSHVTGFSRIQLVSRSEDELPAGALAQLLELIDRRKAGQPIAYLTGEKEFWGLAFTVTPDVLVPRPDTELLVEQVLAHARKTTGRLELLDLGTGSGCIAVAVAHELKKAGREFAMMAVDHSPGALKVARLNIMRHGLSARIALVESDWFSALQTGARFNLIFSNPPYIAPGDPAVSRELKYEPQSALYSWDDGLADIKRLIRESGSFIAPGGSLLFEIGSAQADPIRNYAVQLSRETVADGSRQWFSEELEVHQDLAGLDRVVAFHSR
jgi:release factor glutamine methyltransferase